MRIKEAIATFRGHRVPNMNLIGRRNVWFALSGTFIVLSLVGLFARGLNFSIEFKGGSQLQFENRSGVAVKTFQAIMAKYGLPDARVEIVGGRSCPSGCVQIRAKSLTELGLTPAASPSPTPTTSASASASASASPSPTASASASPTPAPSPTQTVLPTLKGDQLRAELAQAAGISPNDINEQDVGPTFGGTISQKMFTGLIVFLVLVSLYISLRFEWKMAVSALIALAHDLIITAGIYALVGREVTPETVIAILTILGYSLYDTVVIFDKVKENTESVALVAKETYSGVVNMSLNQTLMRSVNTSLVVLFPIGALLLFGGQTLKDFAFALFIGVASGTYSSIFVAAPILALLKEREPRYQQIRARATARASRPGLRAVSRSELAAAGGDGEMEPTARVAAVPARSGGGQAARPRSGASSRKKKGRPQGKPKRRRR